YCSLLMNRLRLWTGQDFLKPQVIAQRVPFPTCPQIGKRDQRQLIVEYSSFAEATARQESYGAAVGGGVAGLARLRTISNTSRLAASSAVVIMKMANFLELHDGSTASAGTFLVRFIPSGVASKAQEIYMATANPTARITTSAVTTEVRSSWPKSKSDTASTTSHAITAYAAATL